MFDEKMFTKHTLKAIAGYMHLKIWFCGRKRLMLRSEPCVSCSSLQAEVKPVLERLATDPDMDVKFFALEAISGRREI